MIINFVTLFNIVQLVEHLPISLQPPIQVFGIEGRYAHAMYSAAAKEKSLEKVEKELVQVDELIKSNEKLSEYLANPTLDKMKKQCMLFIRSNNFACAFLINNDLVIHRQVKTSDMISSQHFGDFMTPLFCAF